ncbi:UxaA family hydrolase [Roseomonas populi]|uniref:Altronate dehydratase family protein n=1 Tax=Roseomonas populi TaxID=3121582 RepID=A0ABT1X2N7_9PROT|nr:altronate dehydratase family protein [Roseomonas pecuniae]MCR0982363.1 altronate dehydratase family protein [Roseomonas pecuniae]
MGLAAPLSRPTTIRADLRDNTATALRPLRAGAVLDAGVTAREDVPPGHKLALRDIGRGEAVLKAGIPIGVAAVDIPAGARVHGGLLAPATAAPLPVAGPARATAAATFQGFLRQDGRVGTRNFIGVVIASNCGATAARQAADWFDEERLADFPNVDGVVPLIHAMGCGMEMTGEPMDLLRRTLSGVIRNPNMAGAVIVALGCERNNLKVFLEKEGLEVGDRLRTVTLQEVGGTRAAVEAAKAGVQAMLPAANAARRTTVLASRLVLGLQTGAADGLCGLSANPALGVAVDMLVAQGGTAILSETPDILLSGDAFAGRVASPEVAAALRERLGWWQEYGSGRESRLDGNLDRGGERGGFASGLERALDGLGKAGSTPIAAVHRYAERVRGPGLVFMDSPDHDPVSVTGQAAAGATLIAMTTGLGTDFGSLPAPTVKIASNSETYRRMSEAIDLDAGPVLDGTETVEAAGERIFQAILRHASGEKTKGEIEGMGESGFAPWPIGVCS